MYSRISKFRNANVSAIPKSEQAQIQTCTSSFEGSSTNEWLALVADTPSKSQVHIFKLTNGLVTSVSSKPTISVSCCGEVLWLNILNGDARERSEKNTPGCCTLTTISRGGILSSWLVSEDPKIGISQICTINIPIRSGRISCVRSHPSARGIFAVSGIGSGLWICGLGTKQDNEKNEDPRKLMSQTPFVIPVPVDKPIHSLDWGIDREKWSMSVTGESTNDYENDNCEREIQLHSTLYILCHDGWVYRADAGYAISSSSKNMQTSSMKYCMPTIRLFHFANAEVQPQQDAPFRVSEMNKVEMKEINPSRIPPVMQSHLFVMRNWDTYNYCNERYSTTPIILCTPDNRTGRYSLTLHCVITDYSGKYEEQDCTQVMCFQLSSLELSSEAGGLPPLHYDNSRTVLEAGSNSGECNYSSIMLCGGYGRNNVIWFGIGYGGIASELIQETVEKLKAESTLYEYIMPGTNDKRLLSVFNRSICETPVYNPTVGPDSYISSSGILRLGVYDTSEMTKTIAYQDSCYSGIMDSGKDGSGYSNSTMSSGSTEYLTRFFIAGTRYLSPVTLMLNRTSAPGVFSSGFDKVSTPIWSSDSAESDEFISPQSPSHVKTSHEWVQQLIGCGQEFCSNGENTSVKQEKVEQTLEKIEPVGQKKVTEEHKEEQLQPIPKTLSDSTSKPIVSEKNDDEKPATPSVHSCTTRGQEAIPCETIECKTLEKECKEAIGQLSDEIEETVAESNIFEINKKLDKIFDILGGLKADIDEIKHYIKTNNTGDLNVGHKIEEVNAVIENVVEKLNEDCNEV